MNPNILIIGCREETALIEQLLQSIPDCVVLANHADDLTGFVSLENEIALDNDGWALLAPLGEHRKTRSVQKGTAVVEEHYVQIVDDAAIDAVLANESGSGLTGFLKRVLLKRPIYNGHPDVKLYAPETVTQGSEQLIPLGVNEGLRKTTRGLEFRPMLAPNGAQAVEAGSKYPSALFLLQKTGRVRPNGDIEVRPFKVASIGLTAFPNISGVDSLANAKPNTPAARPETETKTDTIMKQLLIGWLAAQGVALANDSSEQAVFDAFLKQNGTAAASLTALGNEKTNLTSSVNSLTGDKSKLATGATLPADLVTAANQILALTNEKGDIKAERKARFEAVVDLRIAQGKLAVADREAKVNDLIALANDKIEDALKALDALPVKFQVATALGNDRKAGADVNRTAQEKVLALANSDPRYKDQPFTPALFAKVLDENPSLKEELNQKPAAAATK